MALVRGSPARHDHHHVHRDEFSEAACARLLCPRRNICLVSLTERHFLIPPAARWCNSVEDRDVVKNRIVEFVSKLALK